MVNEKIEKRIEETDWKFSELLQLKQVSENVAQEVYEGLTYAEKLSLVWEEKITADGEFFGSVFEKLVKKELCVKVMDAFKIKFEDAKVKFASTELEIKEEVELPPPPMAKEEEVEEQVEEVEEVEEEVENKTLDDLSKLKGNTSVPTRYGNIRVTRG